MKICCFRRKLKFSHFPFQFYWAFLLTISALQGIPSFSSMRVVAAILLLFFIFSGFQSFGFFFFLACIVACSCRRCQVSNMLHRKLLLLFISASVSKVVAKLCQTEFIAAEKLSLPILLFFPLSYA